MKKFAFAPLLVLFLGGCSQIDRIPDDKLAEDLFIGGKKAVEYGLKLALKKVAPDVAKEITQNALLANSIIKAEVLPILSGASTQDVLRAALDLALKNLWTKLRTEIREAVQLSLSILISNIELPKNPADRLDERSRKALMGLFSGISQGVDAVLAPPPAATAAPETGFKIDR
jgi:hypothetical protein